MKWVALLLFGGLGLTALTGGLVWTAKRYRLISRGRVAHGKVVTQREYKPDTSMEYKRRRSESSSTYYAVVEFQTEQ